MTYTTRATCRICPGKLETIIDLGEIYLSDFTDGMREVEKAPLDLTKCVQCDLVQLRHTVSGSVMYEQYWYQSGLNKSMVAALQNIVENTCGRAEIFRGDVILDIGCNDGTSLALWKEQNHLTHIVTIGFDPSKNLAKIAQDRCDYFINDYFNAANYFEHIDRKARVITSIAMFYDLENPHTFIKDVKAVLAYDGIWVVQMMDLMSMIKQNDLGNICHEHLGYYSLSVFKNLIEQHDLEIFDLEYNTVNGGSLRTYICHKNSYIIHDKVIAALQTEQEYFTSLGNVYEHFSKQVKGISQKLNAFFYSLRGDVVAVMGASTKGNTLLQIFDIDNQWIDHAAEINPDKFGLKTVGTNIPIIAESESLKINPDYYLILPFGFILSFIKNHRKYLQAGGKFIVLMPAPAIISCENGEIVWKYL